MSTLKNRESQIKSSAYTSTLKTLEKLSRKKEMIKTRVEINEIENKTIEKINENKSWFSEKIDKIDKPLSN